MNTEPCQKYLDALNSGNLEKVLLLFTKDAIVVSPLYGEMSVRAFYTTLFQDTQRSETRLLNVFRSANDQTLGLHFQYNWTLKDGELVNFEVVDVFELSQDGKFKKLTIIYDTHKIRNKHQASLASNL